MLFEEPQPQLFDENAEPGINDPMTDEGALRTARLAAFGRMNLSEQAGNIFAAMDDEIGALQEQIAAYGDAVVRAEAAADLHQRRLGALQDVIRDNLPEADPALTAGAAAAYANLERLDAQEDAAYALEQRAVENIQNLAAQGDIVQARVMLSNLENGNALDVMRDMSAKQLILQNMVDKAQIRVEDQGWLRHLADFALGFIPFYSASRTGNVDTGEVTRRWYDSLFAGQRYRSEADALWDMPIKEFSQYVNEDFIRNLHENATLFGYTNNTEELELLSGLAGRTPSATETNLWSGLDVGGFIPFGQIGRGGMGLAGMMVRNGARREAAELTAKTALDVIRDSAETGARNGLNMDEVTEALSVRAVSPNPPDIRVGIATTADEAMARGRALMAELPALERQARLAQNEVSQALNTLTQRLERQFKREIKDVDVVEGVQYANGSSLNRIIFTLGRKDGSGFANEAQANRYLSSIDESGMAIRDDSGQWFVRFERDMPETGFTTNLLNVKTSSPARFVLNARNVGDLELANAAQVAGNARNKLLKILVEPYSNTFRSLRGQERDAIAQVLQAGETNATWFNRDQIEQLYQRRWNRSPSEREFSAYQAARDINDIEFVLRNDDVHKQRAVRDFRTVSFDTQLGRVDRANAIVDHELKDIPRQRVFDITSGTHYTQDNPLTPKIWERLRNRNYIMVTLEEPLKMADGTTIKTFMMRGQDAVVENLRRDQVAYRPGGHRMYRGKYFVKQTVRGVQPDTMQEYLENPNTYIVAETKAEADFWASRMEAARIALVNGEDLAVIDEILGGHAGFPSAEEFVRLVDEGVYQRNTSFGTYFDREMPEEYLADGQILDLVDLDESGFNGFLRTQGRMYTGRKGEQLPDYMGNLAPLLDPYEVINRSLMNIASLSSFGDYKIQSVERWMKTFGSQLDVRDIPEGVSNMRLFMEAPLKKGGNDAANRVRSAALAQRQIIKRTLGWKTDNDLRAEQWARHLNEWVQGSRVDGALPNARKALTTWWQDSNPISALRSFAFDLKLGLFNIAQLPMQISTAAAATAMSPKNGMQGWAMIAPMRFVLGGRTLSREAFEARLEQLAKNGVDKLGGFETAKEFKEFARAATRSGFFDLGGTHGLMDHYGPSATLDGFNSGVERAREAGRFFFYEAERWNRIVAWRIAWDEAKETGLKPGSAEFARKLAGRAEEYAFNMSRESQAWWQKGVLSIPTQFWAYNARMLEAMTVGNFTPAQKLRLILSQTLLYGSAGLPITGFVSEMMKNSSGEVPDIETPLGMLDRGLLDTAIYQLTGADVLAGKRLGTGGWAVETVRNIFGMSQYGEVSAAEMLGGATFNIMGKLGVDVFKVVTSYMTAESGDTDRPMTRDALTRLVSNISTVGNITKALMVYNYGIYQSNSGTALANDLPSQTAFAVMLGIQPAEMDEISAMMAHFKDKGKQVDEAAKVINTYRTRMINQPDQRETLEGEINAFVRLLPEDVRRDALERAHSQVDPSLYASLVERLEKEQAERDGFAN